MAPSSSATLRTYAARCARTLLLALGMTGATLRGATARPESVTIEVDGVAMEFVLIHAGSFLMGSDDNTGGDDESPVHRVTISQDFYLGKYEVTQAQWEKVMHENPSRFRGPALPVESVNWNQCQAFLTKLGARTGRRFALPTEAQWEYACRAGSTTRWSFGDAEGQLGDYAWCGANSGGAPHPVGGKKPNPWGLYDMHGNVGEWTADGYEKHTYASGEATDPHQAPAPGRARVWRGGAWGDNPDFLRSGYRNASGADIAQPGIGLRCVLLVEPAASP